MKCCEDPNKLPFQWIYLVDDAWFHPEGITFDGDLNPPIINEQNLSPIAWEKTKAMLEEKAKSEQGMSQSEEEEEEISGGAAKSEKPFNDAEIALLIGNLAVEKGYGICLCSFEYFWDHYEEEINRHYNAVFFDINHALRSKEACKSLNTFWEQKLSETMLYSKTVINSPLIHGWLLHFAIKLGCKNRTRAVMDHSHILLISSRFSIKDTATDPSAAGQFGSVTLDIWTNLFAAGDEARVIDPNARMADFGFTPFQKVVHSTESKAQMLENGFKFFDRTFSKQGQWSTIRKLFQQDLAWARGNASDYEGIHFDESSAESARGQLRWTGWISDWQSDLKGAYDERANSSAMSMGLFLRILKASAVKGMQALQLPNECCQEFSVEFPKKPEIEVIAHILDFADALSAAREDRIDRNNHNSAFRIPPSFSLVLTDAHLVLKIEIPHPGVQKLNENLQGGVGGNATKTAKVLKELGILCLNTNIEIKLKKGL
jgi:hypothetical protein